jgi:hypothetical protein
MKPRKNVVKINVIPEDILEIPVYSVTAKPTCSVSFIEARGNSRRVMSPVLRVRTLFPHLVIFYHFYS